MRFASCRRFLPSGPVLCLTFCLALCLAGALPAAPAFAQAQAEAGAANRPALPAPLQNLVKEGAQVYYLGKSHKMDGWVAIQNGQEQYFYVPEDGQSFLLGLLFDKDGKVVTLRQVQDLQKNPQAAVLDQFSSAADLKNPGIIGAEAPSPVSPDDLPKAADIQAQAAEKQAQSTQTAADTRAFKSPAEQLFSDVEASNWVPMGDPKAPVIYSFMDPQCPHCHNFMEDLRANYIDNGLVQLRVIPVGFNQQTLAQAAYLLAAPDPQRRWYAHLDGDQTALPAEPGINEQGVQRNLAVMQTWKLNVTPLSLYRAKDGTVKVVQGRAKDLAALIGDLP